MSGLILYAIKQKLSVIEVKVPEDPNIKSKKVDL
jgi:hypothetical protein